MTIASRVIFHAAGDWTNILAIGGLVSAFIDETPGSDVVERHVYNVGLADLVNSLCQRLDAATATAVGTTANGQTVNNVQGQLSTRAVTPFAIQEFTVNSTGQAAGAPTSGGATQVASNGTATTGSGTGLPLFEVFATQPPPLTCGPALSPTPPPS